MPVITDIKRQQKHGDRLSIYVDDKFVFGLEDIELSRSDLRIGRELSAAEIKRWQYRSAEAKAYNAALRYLSYRPRSQNEMVRYLRDKEYDDTTIELSITRLEEVGLIDDRAFAKLWVADRMRLRPRSRIILAAELRQKGVAPELTYEVLAGLGREDELEALRRLIIKKRSRYADEAKLIGYLGSKGYNYGLIKEAIRLVGGDEAINQDERDGPQ